MAALLVNDVRSAVKAFVLAEFLSGEDPNELTDEVELMTLGILDSVGVLKLVAFLEERFSVTLAPHEVGKGHLNTLRSIAGLVVAKRSSAHESA